MNKKSIGSVMVVGGGVSGIAAALGTENRGYEVSLVEKNSKLGGNLNNLIDRVNKNNKNRTKK